jgi:hypothetical protein
VELRKRWAPLLGDQNSENIHRGNKDKVRAVPWAIQVRPCAKLVMGTGVILTVVFQGRHLLVLLLPR